MLAPFFSGAAGTQRAKPPGLPTLPINLVACYGVGSVATTYSSAVDASIAYLPSIYNSTACTVGTGGSDSVAAGNTFFATISFACKTWTGGSVVNCVSDITENGLDFRSTDTSQIGVAKTVNGAADNGSGLIRLQTTNAHTFTTGQRVVVTGVGGTTEANGNWLITVIDSTHFDLIGSAFANAFASNGTATNQIPLLKIVKANGFNVIWRTAAAVDPTTATWTADGSLTNIYSAGSAWLASSAQVTRVLRTDQTDSYGYYKQFVSYASKAALAAATTTNGYFWDNSGKELWLHLAGDANVETNKAVLKCMFLNTSGTSRTIVQGAALATDGLRMEGVQFVMLDLNGRRPSIWNNNLTQLWATSKGYDGTNAGDFVETNSLCYASAADCRNPFAASATGAGLIQTVKSRYINAGDMTVFAADGTLQGVSAHGGSNHVSFGSQFIGNNGPGISDTCANNKNDVSWLVGCDIETQQNTSVANMTFGSAATSATRLAYLDTCKSVNAGTFDLQVDANATVQAYQTPLASVSGSVARYAPGNPQ